MQYKAALIACVASIALPGACCEPCEVDYPVVRGGDYTGIYGVANVQIVSSTVGYSPGEQYTGEVFLRSDYEGGIRASFDVFYDPMGSQECSVFQSDRMLLPLDGSTVSLACTVVNKNGTITMHFVEDSLETVNPAIGRPGRFEGEYRNGEEHYTFVIHDFFDEIEGCQGDACE